MTQLKDLLKPPFELRIYVYNKHGTLLSKKEEDSVLEYMRIATKEKGERDFGEPLRWVLHPIEKWKVCPICNAPVELERQYNYCPSCGKRLLPREREGE